jgi:hypothetical protein
LTPVLYTKTSKPSGRRLDTASLPSGVTITPTYRIDDAAEVVQSEFAMGSGDTKKVATIAPGTFKRIVYGFDIASSGTATPKIYGATLQWNPKYDQKSF